MVLQKNGMYYIIAAILDLRTSWCKIKLCAGKNKKRIVLVPNQVLSCTCLMSFLYGMLGKINCIVQIDYLARENDSCSLALGFLKNKFPLFPIFFFILRFHKSSWCWNPESFSYPSFLQVYGFCQRRERSSFLYLRMVCVWAVNWNTMRIFLLINHYWMM